MSDVFTAYVTKYALTKGILEMQVEETSQPGMVKALIGSGWYFHGEGRDWHRTFEAAQGRAKDMRIRKIEALKYQIERLEWQTFDAPVKVE